MPEAILRVLLNLLSLDHPDYWEEVDDWDGEKSIHRNLAEETEAVPDDEILASWEEWVRPLQSMLSEEMARIDAMEGAGLKAPGDERLLRAIAFSFHLMKSPSKEVSSWVASTAENHNDGEIRTRFEAACDYHRAR